MSAPARKKQPRRAAMLAECTARGWYSDHCRVIRHTAIGRSKLGYETREIHNESIVPHDPIAWRAWYIGEPVMQRSIGCKAKELLDDWALRSVLRHLREEVALP